MKKITLIIFAIAMVLISILCQKEIKFKKLNYRYEQHIEAKKSNNSGEINSGDNITHLPIISINTNNQKIPGKKIVNEKLETIGFEKGSSGEEQIIVDISIYDNSNAQNTLSGEPTFFAKALFNIRGNSSRSFEKSNYKIQFVKENNFEKEKKYSILGISKGSTFALHGPFIDKTLIRNYMWMNISANIMGYAPNVRFCECYVDGEYKGLYVLMETIEKAENRVNISSYKKNSRMFSYLLKLDKQIGKSKEIETFSGYSSHLDDGTGFTVLYPKAKDLSGDVKAIIAKDISKFEKTLYSYDFKDPKIGYRKYIDVDSWVDFYVIQEFLINTDMCSRSTYLYKEAGWKLKMGPVWDFNNCLDNYLEGSNNVEGFYFTENRIWYEMLMKDEYFVNKVIKRYKELRKTYLNEEYLLNYIDETIAYLGDAVDRNYKVWGYTFERENQTDKSQYLSPIERNPQNYEEAIEIYKNFLVERGKWLDNNIESLKQYCHSSKIKLYVE